MDVDRLFRERYSSHVMRRVPRADQRPGVEAEYRCRDCGAVRLDRLGPRGGTVRSFIEDGVEYTLGFNEGMPACPARVALGTRPIVPLNRR